MLACRTDQHWQCYFGVEDLKYTNSILWNKCYALSFCLNKPSKQFLWWNPPPPLYKSIGNGSWCITVLNVFCHCSSSFLILLNNSLKSLIISASLFSLVLSMHKTHIAASSKRFSIFVNPFFLLGCQLFFKDCFWYYYVATWYIWCLGF